MPHINLQISGKPDAALTERAAGAVAALTESVLGKRPELIAITVQYIEREAWIIAGKPLSAHGRNAFHLDISVTDETNTKAEKARYLQAVYQALSELIGDVHPCSYIHVIDARAAAYGYGGRTQEYRYQHAQ
ncbi:4-oxalocrotonate tautomerase family protein [Cupriavidus respiraculi]|uniref:tautomerase family protein n=1 Tax=Cupriavidus respiraculi TaxID=195930 RepID=UPI001C95070F|nr:4-oxalocrotonate tautomerase family protein [Cupriavidus respiraculi]MBY4949367.1 4-oxalocrotonate tautomerase family protein [Cupriavidus respiraculi]